jgi:preprotein translocase subunit SecG
MSAVEITFGVILCVMAVALITCVLLQSGKEKSLSGTIAGAAESFFSKSKGKTKDKIFSRVTTILSFVFAALVVVVYVITNI